MELFQEAVEAAELDWYGEDMAQWVVPDPDVTKGQIDRAGRVLANWWFGPEISDEELSSAFRVVDTWRSSHGYPLNAFAVNLRARAKKVESDAIIAQRLKRTVSVMVKLANEQKMALSQMHDLGGCRAIMSNVQNVRLLYDMYREHGDLFDAESNLKCYDYLKNPKDSGYRGIHVVGRFAARLESRSQWNGHRIEIQLRSRLQHAFATTVETVATFTVSQLKAGRGSEQWKRFFSLVGSAIALREGTEMVPSTPSDPDDLITELREVSRELRVKQRLQGWANAVKVLPRRNVSKFKVLLLVLDPATSNVAVIGFQDREKASEALHEQELNRGKSGVDAVLVQVNSLRNLRAAYPNYYADTRQFLKALDVALGPSPGW